MSEHVRIAIVGTGFSGLGTAIRLLREGIRDFVVLEREDDLGGAWRDNTYPGCRCDIPSHLYSFSFALNPGWSRTFSPQPEIWDYLRDCAERHGVTPHIRYGHEVRMATWDDERALWDIETPKGRLTAEVLISGMGALSQPAIPPIPGLDDFQGTVFHSAEWDHDHDLTGDRVAVIGTGASAIQFVPRIQPKVSRLHLFQRSAPWVMPRPDRDLTPFERRLFQRIPAAQRLLRAALYWARESLLLPFVNPRLAKVPERLARMHLRRQVRDPELRRKLTPDYTIGCKRILISDDYYPSLTQPNVEVVTDGIREVRASSVITADGREREVDTIILGTGFHVVDMAVGKHVRGRDGLLLEEVWSGSPEAYLGTTVTGFPNLFILTGPNTTLGHSSMVFMIESQINYVIDCLRTMDRRGARRVEVRPEVQAAFNREVQSEMEGTVWASGCASWYLDAGGRNRAVWPESTWSFRRRTRHFDAAAYSLVASRT